ncbi:SH3 domain-containing protein [Ideonella sp.]|jgi:hypothetical protein|uniref:SH3 domain-containing protein n=1 Tax=Ideonella sp. TaxID=1929293 RepID=UPI0037C08AE4
MPTPTTPPKPDANAPADVEADSAEKDAPSADTRAAKADGPSAVAAHAFWGSLPGILTGLATVLTAATGLFVALRATSPAIAGGGPSSAPPASQGAAPAPTAPPRITPPRFEAASAVRVSPALRAILQDPDGFSNLRAAPGTRSAIITRLPQGQSLERLREEDGWWLVRTPEGQTGWVHGSRLKGEP